MDENQQPFPDKEDFEVPKSYDPETTLRLELPNGTTLAAGLKLPPKTGELMAGKTYALTDCSPQSLVRSFIDESVPIAHGIVTVMEAYRQAALFADDLAVANIYSIIRSQQAYLLIVPVQCKTLSFLPKIQQSQEQRKEPPLKFHVLTKTCYLLP
jgi:hypothetical protein